jgi:hypothetical protein
MTIARAMKGALVLVLSVLPAARALGVDVEGHLGLGYSRTDTYTDAAHLSEPTLMFDGGLGAYGYVVDPGVVDWSLGAGYTNQQSVYTQSTSRAEGLTYRGQLGLLEARGTKLSLGGSVARTRQDFSSESNAVTTTGTTITDGYEAHMRAGGWPNLPSLHSSFAWDTSLNHGFDRPDTRVSNHAFDVGVATGPFDVQVDYSLRWSDGTLEPVNFKSHQLRLSSHNQPSDKVDVHIDTGYFLREPDVFAPGNPRYEDTLLGAGVVWIVNPGDQLQANYRYTHNLVTDPGILAREALSNSINGSYRQRLSQEWLGTWGASATAAQTRLGTDQQQSTGESVDATGSWRHPVGSTTYGADLGARVGLLQPETGPGQGAYGGSAGVNVGWKSAVLNEYMLAYTISYDRNLDAAAGWQTRQFASATVAGMLAPPFSAGGRIEASAARGGGGIFGDSANRSILGQGSLGYRRLQTFLDLGITDAVTGALSNPMSDGLFLPPGYNTHARFASLGATFRLTPNIGLHGRGRWGIASGPTISEQREALYEAGVAAASGPWVFSLDERYTMGGSTGFDHRVNQIFLNVNRTFGTRY